MRIAPTVSIIVPTKNRAEYFAQAIQSALHQTFEDFEIVVVDSASTDNTRTIVENFKDKRIRYIRQDEDRGQSASRNEGVKHAKGEFVAFLDDDDLWFPAKLDKQLRKILKNPNVGLVSTGRISFKDGFNVIKVFEPFVNGKSFFSVLRKNCVGNCSTVMVRKRCFEKVGGFDENLPCVEDHDLWIRIAKKYQVDCLKEPLAWYRVHGKNVSFDSRRIIKAKQIMFRKYAGYLKSYPRIRRFWHYKNFVGYLKLRKFMEATKELLRIFI